MITSFQSRQYFIKITITTIISLVWLINGLVCKVLNFVPRHQLIVARILGENHSFFFTKIIGVLEILMSFWIVSGIKSRWCAIFQCIVIATMNIIEFILAPDLLLFGKMNIVFAACFIIVIIINEFILKRNLSKPA